MVRKYRFADPCSVICILLDLTSLFMLSDNKILWGIVLFIAAAAAVSIRIYYPVDINSMLLTFDFSMAFVLLSFVYAELRNTDINWILPASASCILALICILFMRINTGRIKGKFLSLTAFIFVALVALLLISFVANPAGNLVIQFFKTIVFVISYLGKLFYRFIEWLIDLLPDVELEPGDLPEPAESLEMPEGYEEQPMLGAVIAIIIIAAVAVFLIIALLRMKLDKAPRYIGRERIKSVNKKRSRLSEALKKLWESVVHEFRMLCYMTKNNELARYYRLVYKNRFSKKRKQKSETPREYIKRVGSGLDPMLIEKLLYS